MRIAIVASLTASLINFRGPLIDALRQDGHEVIACAPDEDPVTVSMLQQKQVTFYRINFSRTGLNPFKDISFVWSLYRLFRQVKPDIVLSYTVKPVIYGSLVAWMAGVPRSFSIITGLGYAFGTGSRKHAVVGAIVRGLYRASLSHNTAVFFQNPDDCALFADLGLARPDQSVLINGSGVDLDHYALAPPVLEPVSFLLMARLIEEKGIMQYAEAARQLKARYPSAVFRLLGAYDTNPSAIRPAQLQAWEQFLEYHGETRDVRPLLAQTSVYVLPSYYREGTPRSILEAMSMGRPVITTDTPGCRETIIDGESGFLVPIKDAGALAAAMEKFITQHDLILTMGKNSRARAVEKYDVHKVNAKIMQTMQL